jgi:hypothetical protein
MVSGNFTEMTPFLPHLGIFYMPQICDMGQTAAYEHLLDISHLWISRFVIMGQIHDCAQKNVRKSAQCQLNVSFRGQNLNRKHLFCGFKTLYQLWVSCCVDQGVVMGRIHGCA